MKNLLSKMHKISYYSFQIKNQNAKTKLVFRLDSYLHELAKKKFDVYISYNQFLRIYTLKRC